MLAVQKINLTKSVKNQLKQLVHLLYLVETRYTAYLTLLFICYSLCIYIFKTLLICSLSMGFIQLHLLIQALICCPITGYINLIILFSINKVTLTFIFAHAMICKYDKKTSSPCPFVLSLFFSHNLFTSSDG